MIDPFLPSEQTRAHKRPRWLVVGWVLLAICHGLVVWSARAVGIIPLWLLVAAAIFLGVAGPHLLERLDSNEESSIRGSAPLSAAERDRLLRLMAGFVVAVLLFVAVAAYFLFFSASASLARAPEVTGTVSHEMLGSAISLRGTINSLNP